MEERRFLQKYNWGAEEEKLYVIYDALSNINKEMG
jgi:hypothetical protein